MPSLVSSFLTSAMAASAFSCHSLGCLSESLVMADIVDTYLWKTPNRSSTWHVLTGWG